MLLLLASLGLGLAAEGPTVTVSTFNAGLAHGYVDHAESRRDPILQALRDDDSDVICLQEVWDQKDRARFERELGEAFPHRVVHRIEAERAAKAPACKRKDLFGEGKFVACMSEQCGELEGDARNDCILQKCDAPLKALRSEKPACAQALFAQVGRSPLGAVLALLSPFRPARTYAYYGSDGLMLLSRHELQNPGMIDFTEIATLNRRKALHADIRVDDQRTLRVYCTHLTADLSASVPYPGPFPSWAEENRAQMDQLLAHANSSELPTVITGDFNCGLPNEADGLHAEAEASCQAVEDAGFVDAASLVDPVPCTWCTSNLLNIEEGDTKNALLDHLFLRGVKPIAQGRGFDEPISIEVKKEGTLQVHLSDHFGYRAVLAFGDPRPPPPEPAEPEPAEPVPTEPETESTDEPAPE